MPQTIKPPRLYLRPARADRVATWVILHNGIEHSTGAGKEDIGKAQEALVDYIANQNGPAFGHGDPAKVMIADVLAQYGTKHAPTTADPARIGYAIDHLLEFWEGTVSTITPESCTDYLTWRTSQRDARAKNGHGRFVKRATARRELVVLAAALQWCYKSHKLIRPIPIQLPKQADPREIHLDRAEAACLLAAALGWYRDEDHKIRRDHGRINRHLARFILVGLYTGTRHDAILKLQWDANTRGGWIDLRSLTLYRRALNVEGGSSKLKTTIPLPPRLVPHARRWRKLTARFVIEWQGVAIASQLRRSWKGARIMAGLDARFTPHVLRHTCATWLLQRGVSIYDTAGVLGCSEEVVRRTYGHHAKENMQAAVAAFSRRA